MVGINDNHIRSNVNKRRHNTGRFIKQQVNKYNCEVMKSTQVGYRSNPRSFSLQQIKIKKSHEVTGNHFAEGAVKMPLSRRKKKLKRGSRASTQPFRAQKTQDQAMHTSTVPHHLRATTLINLSLQNTQTHYATPKQIRTQHCQDHIHKQCRPPKKNTHTKIPAVSW